MGRKREEENETPRHQDTKGEKKGEKTREEVYRTSLAIGH
jgi:hypothetical protein